jgi:hypothetical protein
MLLPSTSVFKDILGTVSRIRKADSVTDDTDLAATIACFPTDFASAILNVHITRLICGTQSVSD